MVFICLDVGGTNTLIGIGNGEFDVVKTVDSAAFLTDIEGSIDAALMDADYERDDVQRIIAAVAGPIDREEGVFHPPNIPVDEVQICAPLEAICKDVSFMNDCTAAVLGEYFYGDHDHENVVYLTISTGIGAGIITEGRLIEGKNGNFGEIGHMIVGNDGLACGCGGTDHWEAYCSGSNLPRMAAALYGAHFTDAIALFEKYYEGDKQAIDVIETMREQNARGLANIVNAYDPDVVLVGGGVALNHPEPVIDGLGDRVQEHVMTDIPDIRLCSLRERSVIHGLRAIANGDATRFLASR